MIKQHRTLLLSCVFILVAGLALWPGGWSPRAYANVTLTSFMADSLPGQPEIYIVWDTATEIDTVGFFIQRSDSATGPFTQVKDFIPSEGDDVTGAEYSEVDDTTVLNEIYYYRLEVVNTDQTSDYHGPIRAVAGVPATEVPDVTDTPTSAPEPTRTPTLTPSPTATSTARPNTGSVNPTAPSHGGSVATPRPVTGATITPQPTSASSSSNLVVSTATPDRSLPATNSPQPAPIDTSVPSVPDAATMPTAVLSSPTVGAVVQVPAPILVPTDAVPAVVAPVVIATEAAPSSAPANTTNGDALILVVAAVLFLGLAFVILRQARQ